MWNIFCNNGTTTILNPYPKPDVLELVGFLKASGFDIKYSTQKIEFKHGNKPKADVQFDLMSDISQIVTFISLATFHKMPLKLTNVTVQRVKDGLVHEIKLFEKIGVNINFGKNSIAVPKINKIFPADVEVTSINIYSDHQPFFALLLSTASEKSKIKELVWKNRFEYARELNKLGFNFKINDNEMHIFQHHNLKTDQTLTALDLRAAATLIIAATKVPGDTVINGVGHLNRGYENFIQDLNNLGGKISLF